MKRFTTSSGEESAVGWANEVADRMQSSGFGPIPEWYHANAALVVAQSFYNQQPTAPSETERVSLELLEDRVGSMCMAAFGRSSF